MVYCLAHHIISPLGEGSQTNWEAVIAGRTAMQLYTNRFDSVEPFCASLFDAPQDFTSLCIRSAEAAIQQAKLDPASQEVIFIISTTKGDNLDLLTPAQSITRHFGNPNEPIVVSNACTSGVCAQITAMRLLEQGCYRHAIVIGCDIQTRFIVSGFQSFKALSDKPCRPFDAERKGLNLGEAAATIIWSKGQTSKWRLEAGSIHNDANHISGPSRTGEGAYRCLLDVLDGVPSNKITMVGVHGTATPYNDEMESIALHRAGLDNAPICALKGYYGHTMGAAGIIETIIGMLAIDNKRIPAAKGYNTCGTSHMLNIHNQASPLNTDSTPTYFIKMLSGFGGTNAAICLSCE